MKLLNSYALGLKKTSANKRIVTTIYAVLFLLALVIVIPFGNTIAGIAGNSMAFTKLLNDFNYTVYTDFMRDAEKAIQPYISIAFWTAVLYLIFTIFFSGGILTILKAEDKDKSLKLFWQGCAVYFWRFLRLAIYMLILQIIIFAIVFIPLSAIIASMNNTSTEPAIFYTALAAIIIYLFFLIILLSVTDYAKIMLSVHDEFRPIRTIIRSFGFVFRHLFSTIGLYKILLVFPVALFILYFIISDKIGMSTGFTIFITFLIQQIFVWLRVFVKIWYLASELDLYSKFDNQKNSAVEIVPAMES